MKRFFGLLFPVVLLFASCSEDSVEAIQQPGENQVSFSKADGADPTLAANQDRITDNVWITRGNAGGQIFNIRLNGAADKFNSPEDTEWAVGDKADRASLTFQPFRDAVNPQDVVGRDLVVHLITDDIYLNVRFTSWSSGRLGGFGYVRDEVPAP